MNDRLFERVLGLFAEATAEGDFERAERWAAIAFGLAAYAGGVR